MRTAVIGGGWAGIAAAVGLTGSGHPVTLFEAGRVLGGRARSVSLDGRTLDNGQHILLGAYRDQLEDYREAMRAIFEGRAVRALLVFSEGDEIEV